MGKRRGEMGWGGQTFAGGDEDCLHPCGVMLHGRFLVLMRRHCTFIVSFIHPSAAHHGCINPSAKRYEIEQSFSCMCRTFGGARLCLK